MDDHDKIIVAIDGHDASSGAPVTVSLINCQDDQQADASTTSKISKQDKLACIVLKDGSRISYDLGNNLTCILDTDNLIAVSTYSDGLVCQIKFSEEFKDEASMIHELINSYKEMISGGTNSALTNNISNPDPNRTAQLQRNIKELQAQMFAMLQFKTSEINSLIKLSSLISTEDMNNLLDDDEFAQQMVVEFELDDTKQLKEIIKSPEYKLVMSTVDNTLFSEKKFVFMQLLGINVEQFLCKFKKKLMIANIDLNNINARKLNYESKFRTIASLVNNS